MNQGLKILVPIKQVLSDWRYLAITLFAAVALFLFCIWLPNLSFVGSTITSSFFTLNQKLAILFGSLRAFETNFLPLGRVILITASLLFGLNISIFIFYMRQRVKLQKEAGLGLGGIALGILGVGCASCGSFVFTSLLGASASIALLGLLPLRGQEFGILGITILGASIVLTARKIQEPLILAGDDIVKKVNIDVNVNGGGWLGQCEASRLAIAKGLVQFTGSKKLEKTFLDYDRNLLVADVRFKEPYKPNDSKARAKRQKSYR